MNASVVLIMVGLALAGIGLTYAVLSAVSALRRHLGVIRASKLMSHWMLDVDRHLKRRKQRVKASVYVVLVTFAALAGVAVGILLKNPLAAILMAALAFVVPEQFFSYTLLKSRLKKFDQLVDASAVFAAELQRVNVVQALENAGKSVPDPVGQIFRRAARDLRGRTDPKQVFSRMFSELDFSYGKDFVGRLADGYQHSGLNPKVAKMFEGLGREMHGKRKILHDKVSQLFSERLVTVVLILLFFPAYAVASSLTPTAWEFLTATTGGRFVVCLYLVSLLIGPLLDYGTIRRLEV